MATRAAAMAIPPWAPAKERTGRMTKPRLHPTLILWQALTGRRDFATSDGFLRFHRARSRRPRKKPARPAPRTSWTEASQPPGDRE